MFLDLGPGLGRPLTYLIFSLMVLIRTLCTNIFQRALGAKPVVLPKL